MKSRSHQARLFIQGAMMTLTWTIIWIVLAIPTRLPHGTTTSVPMTMTCQMFQIFQEHRILPLLLMIGRRRHIPRAIHRALGDPTPSVCHAGGR